MLQGGSDFGCDRLLLELLRVLDARAARACACLRELHCARAAPRTAFGGPYSVASIAVSGPPDRTLDRWMPVTQVSVGWR